MISRKGVGRLSETRGAVLVTTLMVLLALLGAAAVMSHSAFMDTRLSRNFLDAKQAFFLAETGINHAATEAQARDFNDFLNGADDLASTTGDNGILDLDVNGTPQTSVTYSRGGYSVTVYDDNDGDGDPWTDSNNRVFVRSVGTIGSSPVRSRWVSQIYLDRNCASAAFGSVRAAINANGPIETLGTLLVDGRDHDLTGALIADSGTLAISTKSTYVGDGNSDVAGTDSSGGSSSDISPLRVKFNRPALEPVIEWGAEATWDMPLTPDTVLEVPDGTLKGVAMAGTGGSQYVTNPSSLTYPLSGVTYVELPSGTEWSPIVGLTGEGILIVHNSTTDATIKNFNSTLFTGLLIADDVVHIHSTIIGAVFVLTQLSSSGNCIGNGTGEVLFSREAIANATSLADTCNPRVLAWK